MIWLFQQENGGNTSSGEPECSNTAILMFFISFYQTWTGTCNCTRIYNLQLPLRAIVFLPNWSTSSFYWSETSLFFFSSYFVFIFSIASLSGRECLFMLNWSLHDVWTGGLRSIKLMVSSSIHFHLWYILTTVLLRLLVTWRSKAFSKLHCFIYININFIFEILLAFVNVSWFRVIVWILMLFCWFSRVILKFYV